MKFNLKIQIYGKQWPVLSMLWCLCVPCQIAVPHLVLGGIELVAFQGRDVLYSSCVKVSERVLYFY